MKNLVLLLSLCLAFCQCPAIAAEPRTENDRSASIRARQLIDRAQASRDGVNSQYAAWVREADVDLGQLRSIGPANRPGRSHSKLVAGELFIDFELAPGRIDRAVGTTIEEHSGGTTTWIGEFQQPGVDGRHGSVVLSFGKKGLYGSIERDLAYFSLQSVTNGKYFLAEIDPSLYPREDCEATAVPALGKSSTGFIKPGELNKAFTDNCPDNNPAPATRTLDIIALVTPAVTASQDANALVGAAVADINSVLSNSGVTASVRLVETAQVNFAEGGRTHQALLDSLKCSSSAPNSYCNGVSEPGLLDEAHGMRATAGADIVVLFVSQAATAGTTCGVAYVPPTDSTQYAAWAFAVVGDSCAVGPSYHFSHEIVHLLSGYHDRGTSGTPTTSAYGYNYGFIAADGMRSLLGTGNSGCTLSSCPRIPRLSDPDYEYAGAPFGRPFDFANPNNPANSVAADMQCATQRYATTASQYVTPAPLLQPPLAPANVEVTWYCYGGNYADISPGSDNATYYQLQIAGTKLFTWSTIYSGPETFIDFWVKRDSKVRARACNSAGCSGYRLANSWALLIEDECPMQQ